MDTTWIINVGAICAALFSIYKVLERMTTVIVKITEQTRSMNTVKDTMERVSRDIMDVQKDRAESIRRLEKTEHGLEKLEQKTEENTAQMNESINDLRDDIKEIKNMMKHGINKGGE